MTLQEIRNLDRDIITPEIAAGALEVSPQWLRLTAREAPGELGFPVIIAGNRVKIPRLAFIRFMEGNFNSAKRGGTENGQETLSN